MKLIIEKNLLFNESSIRNALLYVKEIMNMLLTIVKTNGRRNLFYASATQ